MIPTDVVQNICKNIDDDYDSIDDNAAKKTRVV